MAQIKVRSDSSGSWSAGNPVLEEGEPGFSSDNNQLKVGDGSTPWAALPVAAGLAGIQGPKGNTGPMGPVGSTHPFFTLNQPVRLGEPLAAEGGSLVPIKTTQANTLSSTTNAFVTPVPFDADVPGLSGNSPDHIGSTKILLFNEIQKVVVMYNDSTDATTPIRMRVGTISGDTVTYGSEITPPQAGYAWGGNPRMVQAYENDKFVFGYSGTAFRPFLYVGQISGSTITFGSKYVTTFELPDPLPAQYWACPWDLAFNRGVAGYPTYARLALVFTGVNGKILVDSFTVSGLTLTSLGVHDLAPSVAAFVTATGWSGVVQTKDWGCPQMIYGSSGESPVFAFLTNSTKADDDAVSVLTWVRFRYEWHYLTPTGGPVPSVFNGQSDGVMSFRLAVRDNVENSSIVEPTVRNGGKFTVTHLSKPAGTYYQQKYYFGLMSGTPFQADGLTGPAYVGVFGGVVQPFIQKLAPNTVEAPVNGLTQEELYFGLSSIALLPNEQVATLSSEGLSTGSQDGTSSNAHRYLPKEWNMPMAVGGDLAANPTTGKVVVVYRDNYNTLEIQTRMLTLGPRTSNYKKFVGIALSAAPAGTPVKVALKGSVIADPGNVIIGRVGWPAILPTGGYGAYGDGTQNQIEIGVLSNSLLTLHN